MKSIKSLIASGAVLFAAIAPLAHANEAWAEAGSPNGGGNNNPRGAAAWNGAVGGGGFNFHNGPIIGNWDDFADFGTSIFNATFDTGSFDNTATLSSNYIQPFGPGATATYGQTFTAGNMGNLDSFSFFLQGNEAPFSVQAFVITWAGGLIGGQAHDESNSTILYASNPFIFTPNGSNFGSGNWEKVTANIGGGGLGLTAGSNYLIGLSTLGVAELQPTGPGISAPDTTSTLLLLALGATGLVLVRRRATA